MSLNLVPAGKSLPDDIYVIIEIPQNADPIKYEVDKDSGAIFVDRFMSTPMFYPCNYGYVNATLSLDGDPVDVLVPTPYPLLAGSVIRCRPVGVLKMTDESGEDAKIVAVPHSKLTKQYDHIQDVNDLPELLKAQIQHFFERYKELEAGKWVKVEGWGDKAAAEAEIKTSAERYAAKSATSRKKGALWRLFICPWPRTRWIPLDIDVAPVLAIGAIVVVATAVLPARAPHQIAVDRQHLQPLDGLLEAQPLLPFVLPRQPIPQGEGVRTGHTLIDDDGPRQRR